MAQTKIRKEQILSVTQDQVINLNSALLTDSIAEYTGSNGVDIGNLNITDTTISTPSGNLNITPATGSNITLDNTVTIDAGVVAGITDLTATTINAFSLGGKLTAGANEIEGSAFDINGGDISAATISGGLTWSSPQDMNSQILTNVNIDTGDIATAVTNTEWDAAYNHVSSNGTDHTYIDQDIRTTSSPTFNAISPTTINAFSLGGKLTGGANEIEGSNFDIDGGNLSAITISGGLTWSAAQDLNNQNLTNVDIDSGAIDGITIGTNSACTELQVDNININGNNIIATSGNIIVTPFAGSSIILDGSVVIDGGVVSGIVTLSAFIINAFYLGGKLSGGAFEIEGTNFDINGGTIDAVTIGTNSPCTELQVDNININSDIISSGSGVVKMPEVYTTNASTRDVYVDADGTLGYPSSARETKTNIIPITDWEKIYLLEPVNYNFRKTQQRLEQGFIAEDLDSHFPEIVYKDPVKNEASEIIGEKIVGMDYKQLIDPMVKCIQEQKKKIDALEIRILALEK